MDKKYKIILFKNGKKYKTFFSTNIKRNAFSKYRKILKQKKPFFETLYIKRKLCVFEVGIIGPNDSSQIFKKDELGRNILVTLGSSNFNLLELTPYWKEELIYDHRLKKRIRLEKIISTYLNNRIFKQIFTLNNKIIIQEDDSYLLFSLKNKEDSHRLLDVIETYFSSLGRCDCLFVRDTSTVQRKYLYNLLEKAGFKRQLLLKHFTY